ncbi:MAG: hypothetical protein PSV16_07055 [Flavobacterium sp.]|nr:hypothetical protein [Flavobacterium sp.]
MEEQATSLESLAQKAATYTKTNIDLFRLKSVDKISDAGSEIVTKTVFVLILSLIAILVNFGLAFWMGDLLGKTYYGFFSVALFYMILLLVIYYGKTKWIKVPVKNAIINNLLDEKQPQP